MGLSIKKVVKNLALWGQNKNQKNKTKQKTQKTCTQSILPEQVNQRFPLETQLIKLIHVKFRLVPGMSLVLNYIVIKTITFNSGVQGKPQVYLLPLGASIQCSGQVIQLKAIQVISKSGLNTAFDGKFRACENLWTHACGKLLQLCPTLCDSLDCSPPGSSVYGDSPGKNTGVGCHVLLQAMGWEGPS